MYTSGTKLLLSRCSSVQEAPCWPGDLLRTGYPMSLSRASRLISLKTFEQYPFGKVLGPTSATKRPEPGENRDRQGPDTQSTKRSEAPALKLFSHHKTFRILHEQYLDPLSGDCTVTAVRCHPCWCHAFLGKFRRVGHCRRDAGSTSSRRLGEIDRLPSIADTAPSIARSPTSAVTIPRIDWPLCSRCTWQNEVVAFKRTPDSLKGPWGPLKGPRGPLRGDPELFKRTPGSGGRTERILADRPDLTGFCLQLIPTWPFWSQRLRLRRARFANRGVL